MLHEDRRTRDFICDRSQGTRHGIVIDPAEQSPDIAAKRAIAAVSAGTKLILVGGSSDTDSTNVHDTIVAIKEALELVTWASSQDSDMDENDWKIPIILFPQGAASLSPAADAITFMMLMNSTDPRFLIEEQISGAPYIRKAGIEPISMGYVICSPGGRAGEVGKAKLLEPNEIDRAASYALTAEMYGFDMLYLEAGSGAEKPVNSDLIKSARDATDLTLIVGGGIRDGVTAKKVAKAGADWIITGNLVEEFEDASELEKTLSEFITKMID